METCIREWFTIFNRIITYLFVNVDMTRHSGASFDDNVHVDII